MSNRMSKDRVKFYLPCRYFQRRPSHNNMSREGMIDVLCRAFNLSYPKVSLMMNDHPEGFYIICRPSQFARFIVYRHELGEGINGIKDLKPELFTPDRPLTREEQIMQVFVDELPHSYFGIQVDTDRPETARCIVQRVLAAEKAVDGRCRGETPALREYDFSKNPACEC